MNDTRAQSLALEGLAAPPRLPAAPVTQRHCSAPRPTRAAIGTPPQAAERTDVDRARAAAQSAFGQAVYAAAYDRGRTLRPQEAVRTLDDESTTANSG